MNDVDFSNLTDDQLHEIHQVAERFESDFLDGHQPSIEAYLEESDVDLRPFLLTELLAIEVELRRANGATPAHHEYAGRFHDYSPQRDELLSSLNVLTDPDAAHQTVLFAGDETDEAKRVDSAGVTFLSDVVHVKPVDHSTVDVETVSSQPQPLNEDQCETLPPGMPRQLGRYQIQRVLGRGGMGTVYLARDSELDRDVALKVPEFKDQRDATRAAERFRREAKSMATVQHPNLCPVYDVGEFDGRLYLTMAYINGPTLHERISEAGAFDESSALELMGTLARAVQFAHDAGIVHRDLKPSNIMVNELGEPVVMDFGLALRQDGDGASTQEGGVVGTPMYMAPEQVEGNQELIGPRSDVYALGVILYHMLCGQPPFDGSVYSILGKTATGTKPPSPSEVASVTPAVEAVVLKAMAFDIEERYQTAEDLAETVDAVNQQIARSGVPPRKRGRVAAASLAVALLAAVIVYVVRGKEIEVRVNAPEDANIELKLTGEGRVISVTGKDGWAVQVKPGTYEMSLHPVDGNLPKDVKFEVKGSNTIVVSRGEKSEITIVRRAIGPDADESHLADSKLPPRPLLPGEFTPDRFPAEPVPAKPSTGRFMDTGVEFNVEWTWAVAPADVDADGDLDFITAANSDTEPCRVWRNLGNGKFEIAYELDKEISCLDVKVGDIDGDGDLDAMFAENNSPVRIWWNDGKQGFTSREPQPEKVVAGSVCLGDLDGDGDLDAILAINGPNRVLLNDGNGRLTDSGRRIGNSATWQSALGDFDRDGDLDLITGNFGQPNRVWWNDGEGRFVDSGQRLGNHQSSFVKVVDFDGDNDLDAVIANSPGPNVLWRNDGRGTFSALEIPPTTFSDVLATIGADVADLNGDRLVDAFFGNGGYLFYEPDQILLQGKNGDFGRNEWHDVKETWCVKLADFDGDGDIDVYLCHPAVPDRILWNANEDEAAQMLRPLNDSGQRIGQGATSDVALIDVNGDDFLDAVTCSDGAGSGNQVWLNNGSGKLELAGSDLGRTPAKSVVTADVDGDGHSDVFLAGDTDELWINDGKGKFTLAKRFESRSKSAAFCDADFDGDADLLTVANLETNEKCVRLWLNDGEGNFEDSGQQLGNRHTGSVVVGDVDGDGDLDFIAANDSVPDEVWLNDGQGLFFRHEETLGDDHPTAQIAMGDLDGDGDFDLVAAMMHQPNAVWLNDGKGRFEYVELPGILPTKAVALSDVDGDGDLDVFFANEELRPDSLWLNDGKAGFTHPIQWTADADTQAVAVGDLDGDGKEDFFLAHGLGEPDRIWRNATPKAKQPKSPDVDPNAIAKDTRHRRPSGIPHPEPRGLDQRDAFMLTAGLLERDRLKAMSADEVRKFLISHLGEQCREEAAALQSLTNTELVLRIGMHVWLANAEVRDRKELVGYTLDEQRRLAISVISPLVRRATAELQTLTNVELMKLVNVFPAEQLAPRLVSIARQEPTTFHTNADRLTFRVTFNKAVRDVGPDDFVVRLAKAVKLDITKVSTMQYDVTVSGGDLPEFNGPVQLRLAESQAITDLAAQKLTDAKPKRHEGYLVDNIAPTVAITRAGKSPTINSVTFNVKFSEPIAGLSTNGLLAHFDFEDSLTDTVGNVSAAPFGQPQFGTGHTGKGIVLDNEDFLRVPLDVTQNALPRMSWGAWVNPSRVYIEDGYSLQVLCTDDKNPADFDRSLTADPRDSGDKIQWAAFRGDQPAGVGSTGVDAKADTWTFIAATYDDATSTMTLYVNDTQRRMATNFTSGHEFFDIGHNPGFGEFFDGTIDDVFVFNRTLSGNEIASIRDNGLLLSPAAFQVETTGSAKSGSGMTVGDTDDADPTTFSVTVHDVSGKGALGVKVLKDNITDQAGNPLVLTPTKSEHHTVGD